MRKVLAVLATLAAWPACWGKLPEWAETHRHPKYPQGRYILGVGVSKEDPEDAAEQARLEVIRQIRVKVESEVEHGKEAFGLGGQEALREQFVERTRQMVHGEVSGIRIAETAKDGNYYALAVLDRLRLAGEIEAEVSEKNSEVERLLEEAEEFSDEGKVPEALGSLSQAYELSLETSARLALYRAVAPAAGKLGAVPPSKVLSEVRRVTSGIAMEKVSGDGQEAREGERLGPMVVRVKSRGRPVEGIRIRFTYADGRRIGEVTTDFRGEAEVEPTARATGPGVGEVVSRIAIRGLPDGMRLEGLPEVRFSYKVLREGVPVAVEVRGPAGEREVEGKLERALGKLGYPLDDRSPIVLKGKVEVQEVKEVQGFGGTRVLADVRLVVSVTVLPSGRALSSADFSGRGIGRDGESAIRAALRKLKVDRAELARALREAEPAFQEAVEELARMYLERARSALREGDYRSAVEELEKVPPEAEVYLEARKLLREARRKLASRPLPTVAVLRPDATGWRGWEAAEALRDMLVTALAGTGKVEVVEREMLDKILEEQKLGTTGLVDRETASRIGKLVGAEYVLLGRVVKRGVKVEVDLRLVSVGTGKVVAASSAEGLEEGLRAVAEELARKLVEKVE